MKKQELLETGIRLTLTVIFFHRCALVYTRWSLKRVQTFQKSEPVMGNEPIPSFTFIFHTKAWPVGVKKPLKFDKIVYDASVFNNGTKLSLMENITTVWTDFYREDLQLYYLTVQLSNVITSRSVQTSLDVHFQIQRGYPFFHFHAHPPYHVWYGSEDIHAVHQKTIVLTDVYPGDHFILSYSYRLVRSIQMAEQTGCDKNQDRRFDSCMRSHVENKLDCKLPPVRKEISYVKNPEDFCSDVQKANIDAVMKNIDAPGVNQHFAKGTDCAMNCDTYMPMLTKEYQKLDKLAWPPGYDNNKSILSIKVFTTQQTIPVEETIYMYGDMDAMADVGGFLGLLLGASCLSIATATLRRTRELLPGH